MATVKNPYPLCKRDQFPMVQIGNKHQCVAEYLDKHIGQKEIVDVVQREEIIYYVFENKYEVPLLCFCCGVPLAVAELDELRHEMCGRRLESMSLDKAEAPGGGEFLEFQLEFSKKGLESQGVTQSIAPEAAVQMRHPSIGKFGEPLFKKKSSRPTQKRGFG